MVLISLAIGDEGVPRGRGVHGDVVCKNGVSGPLAVHPGPGRQRHRMAVACAGRRTEVDVKDLRRRGGILDETAVTVGVGPEGGLIGAPSRDGGGGVSRCARIQRLGLRPAGQRGDHRPEGQNPFHASQGQPFRLGGR